MQPTETPITGNESLADMSRPEAALAQFYRAFNQRDLELMQQNWINSDEPAMDNPLGGIKRGWSEIESVYRALVQGKARVTVEFHDYTLHRSDGFFYAVGRERGELVAANGERLALRIRTSRLFKWVGSAWKQVHHHGSIDDPELLKNYQTLVRQNA